ncbi:MAG: ABC transporter ATP-binding protein/permease [Actinomycetia bacterium]|nr:ABC transporter ATP-binding protein/permease [Actinomycetes bacterium]
MFAGVIDFINEYLRINAIRRMLSIVTVRKSEIAGLVFLAALFAAFEGVGLSMLLPILQYAESGQTAITQGSGVIWSSVGAFMRVLHLPITLVVLLLLAFVPILMRQVVFYLNTWYSAVVANRIGVRMRMQTLDAVLDADPAFFDRHAVGHLVGIAVTQTEAAGEAILAVVKQLSVTLLMVLYVAIMLALSVPLTATTVAFAVLVALVVKRSITRIRDFGVEAANVNQTMMAKIVERFGLMRLVKMRDQKRAESQRIAEYSETMRAIRVKQARLGARIEVLADPLLMLSVFITLYIGITVLGMTLAQLGLMLFVITRLNAKVKEFNAGRQTISTKMAGLLLVQSTTADAAASNTIRRGPIVFTGLKDRLMLDDVSFDYPQSRTPGGEVLDQATPVLRGVSVEIPAGSFTALVGRSGGGKSTLVELLPRLRDVTSGTITFDGVDIRAFDVGTLRKGIGYLTQDAMLFNETVRENLVYGLDAEPSEEQIREAVEGAYAGFVYELPLGLETTLGDRGVRFSGGERQRIALARVLLEDTSILILDEPTSALDSESETYIHAALAKLHGRKTIITVAHRLATVIQADQLLVIDDGRIIERGTHEELIAREGAYRRLFESQLLA